MTPVLCSPSEALLYHDLFRDYNRNIRPVQNVSDIIQVNVDLSVINIRDLDFDEGVLDMVSWVSLVSCGCLFFSFTEALSELQ